MTETIRVIPQLLVKGVAPDGSEYELPGWGHWSAEQSDEESFARIRTGTMNGRANKAFGFVCEKLNGNRELTCKSLRRAFAAGQVRTRGIQERDKHGEVVAVHELELHTRDLVRWLELEFDIKATVNQIACWPKSSEVLDLLFPVGRRARKGSRPVPAPGGGIAGSIPP